MEMNMGCLVWVFLGSLLLLNCSAQTENGYQSQSPLKNVNLAPYQKWLNAYKCMQNYSKVCQGKNVLNMSGIVDVSQNELQDYCEPDGCGDHIKMILNCIHWVKPDFEFINGATVDIIRSNITDGCKNSQAFSTSKYQSSGSTRTMPVLLTLVLIIILIV